MKRISLIAVAVLACIVITALAVNGQLFRHHAASASVLPQALPPGITYKALTDRPEFKSGLYLTSGTGTIKTTINKSLSQNYNSFPSLSYTVTGSQAPVADFYLTSNGTQTLSDVIGNVQVANLQMLTIWSDSLDLTVSAGTTTAYGTSAGTLSIPQGRPWEWDNSMGTAAAQLPFSNWQSFTVAAGTIGTTSGGTAATTYVHLRASVNP